MTARAEAGRREGVKIRANSLYELLIIEYQSFILHTQGAWPKFWYCVLVFIGAP